MSAEEFKAQGNAAFSEKRYPDAIEAFSKAIALDGTNHVLYSNRSAAYAGMKVNYSSICPSMLTFLLEQTAFTYNQQEPERAIATAPQPTPFPPCPHPSTHLCNPSHRLSAQDYAKALEDANQCVKIKPDWGKGYGRQGAAYHGLGILEKAKDAYTAGMKVEPSLAMLKNGLDEVEKELNAMQVDGDGNVSLDGIGKLFQRPDLLEIMAKYVDEFRVSGLGFRV